MPSSDSFERSEHLSEVVTLPPTTLRRRRFLKGIALGSLLALGGGSVSISLYRQYIPLMSMRGAAGGITALAWSPDGKYIASATGVMQVDKYNVDPSTSTTLQIWEAGHGKLVCTYPSSQNGTLYPPLAWSSNSQWFAWWDSNRQYLRLYEAKVEVPSPRPIEHTLFLKPNGSGGQPVVAFSPDGRWLASGGEYSGQLSVYKISDGTPVWNYGQPSDGMITALAWSANSQQLVVGRSNASTGTEISQMMVLDLTSRKLLLQTPQKPLERITSLGWSPDGHLIAAGYGQDVDHGGGYVNILSAHDGKRLQSYQHLGWVEMVTWSPQSTHIVTLAAGSCTVWDRIADSVIATYSHGICVGIGAAAWSPDGRYLVTGGEDKRLCIWQVP